MKHNQLFSKFFVSGLTSIILALSIEGCEPSATNAAQSARKHTVSPVIAYYPGKRLLVTIRDDHFSKTTKVRGARALTLTDIDDLTSTTGPVRHWVVSRVKGLQHHGKNDRDITISFDSDAVDLPKMIDRQGAIVRSGSGTKLVIETGDSDESVSIALEPTVEVEPCPPAALPVPRKE